MMAGRPDSPNFNGKWKLDASDNFDPFLKDCSVGIIKRTAVQLLNSEHNITQDGDKMSVNVNAAGSGKQQDYEIGGSFTEQEINGEESEVSTEWEGERIKEVHRTASFEYTLHRELSDESTMVLHLESPKGTKARRIYKKCE